MTSAAKHFKQLTDKPIILAFLFVSLQLYPMFAGQTLFYGDNYSLLVPGKLFTANWLRQGILPLWNPTIFGGISWIGDISQSLLYPSTILFVIFPPALALNATIFIHLVGTWLAMYYLAKRLTKDIFASTIAATIWTLSPQIAGSMNNLATLQSIAWFPAIALASLRLSDDLSSKLTLASAITAQLAAGYPQHMIYAVVIGMALHLFSQKAHWIDRYNTIARWTKTGIITLLVSAWVLVPFIRTFLDSTRSLQTPDQATRGSLQASMLIKIVTPYFWDHPTAGYKWGPAWSDQPNVVFYLTWTGLGALFVALKSWPSSPRWFKTASILAAVLIIMAFGSQLPFYEYIVTNIPILSGGRYPSMALTPATMLASLVTGYAIKQLKSKKISGVTIAMTSVLALSSLAIWLAWISNADYMWSRILQPLVSHSTFHTFARDDVIIKGILQNITVNALLLTCGLVSLKKNTALLIIVIALDMTFNTRGLLFFSHNSVYDQTSSQINEVVGSARILTRNFNQPYTDYGTHWEALTTRSPFSDSYVDKKELVEQNWLRHLRDGFTPNWNMPVNINVINGYTTLLPADTASIWDSGDETRINFLGTIDPNDPRLDQWAVKYYVTDSQYAITETINLPVITSNNGLTVYERPHAQAYIRNLDGQAMTVTNYHATPNTITFSANQDNIGLLLIANRFDSDWIAMVNGMRTPIKNHQGMMLLDIPPREANIALSYIPKHFIIGTMTSVTTLLSLAYVIHMRKRVA